MVFEIIKQLEREKPSFLFLTSDLSLISNIKLVKTDHVQIQGVSPSLKVNISSIVHTSAILRHLRKATP